jgi:endonuclease-8
MNEILRGKEVQVEFGIKKLREYEPTLKGLRIEKVEAHGKQFWFHLSDDRVILVHLMMWGSWRIYRVGETWDKPRERARVIFRTESNEVVGFSVPVVRVLTLSELRKDPNWGNLGPDPLRSDFSSKEFLRRLKQQASREIGEVLLDQKVIAGIGNILRIEILFACGIHPLRRVESLSQEEKMENLHWTLKLCGKWMKEMGRKNTWIRIYRKSGKPCPECDTLIEFFRQAGRITYACPKCQH